MGAIRQVVSDQVTVLELVVLVTVTPFRLAPVSEWLGTPTHRQHGTTIAATPRPSPADSCPQQLPPELWLCNESFRCNGS